LDNKCTTPIVCDSLNLTIKLKLEANHSIFHKSHATPSSFFSNFRVYHFEAKNSTRETVSQSRQHLPVEAEVLPSRETSRRSKRTIAATSRALILGYYHHSNY
jgi:hypothetical protein